MQKVWSSIDSWKGKHVSLRPPAPAPARGAGNREATDTNLHDVLIRCQLVLVVSDGEAYVRQAGESSAVYEKLYAMHCLRRDRFVFFFFKYCPLNSRLLWQVIVNLLQRSSIRLTYGPTLPSGFPAPALGQTSPAARTTAPKPLRTRGC